MSAVVDLLCLHWFGSGVRCVRPRNAKFRIPLRDFRDEDLQCLTEVMKVLQDPEESRAAMSCRCETEEELPAIGDPLRTGNIQQGYQFPPMLKRYVGQILEYANLHAVVN